MSLQDPVQMDAARASKPPQSSDRQEGVEAKSPDELGQNTLTVDDAWWNWLFAWSLRSHTFPTVHTFQPHPQHHHHDGPQWSNNAHPPTYNGVAAALDVNNGPDGESDAGALREHYGVICGAKLIVVNQSKYVFDASAGNFFIDNAKLGFVRLADNSL
ncbi:hypothetical protein H2200_000943 [Cladophialophora chaetospira]|uniref:Uncharacterized protein n=1 Tax=Cladophialophora chaetospira TaxID=386627 RepID=A0AA38XPI9_9EURO|nr:hypothetical protein H2200_000943 [Cladophialophora chaetospira]